MNNNYLTNGENSKEIIGVGIAGIIAILMILSTLAGGASGAPDTTGYGSDVTEEEAPEGAFGASGSVIANNFFMIDNFKVTTGNDEVISGTTPDIGAVLESFNDYEEMYADANDNESFEDGETILTGIVEIDKSGTLNDYDGKIIENNFDGPSFKYTDDDNNDNYTAGEAVIDSDDDILHDGDAIEGSGLADMIESVDTHLAYYDTDNDDVFEWGTDNLYYDADGDGNVSAEDNRYGELLFDVAEGDVYAELGSDDPEIEEEFDFDVTDNTIGWINTSDSSKGGIDGGDEIFVDTNNNGMYDENDVVLLDNPHQADPSGSTTYTAKSTTNIEWETGTYDAHPSVLIDVGDDGYQGENDIAISNGDVDVGVPTANISGTPVLIDGGTEVLKALDLDNSGDYSADDSVYVDVDGDGEVSVGDYRLTYWSETYGVSGQWTGVSATDRDAGRELTAFDSDDNIWITDDNHDDSYTVGDGTYSQREAVVWSTDWTLDSGDSVLISGLADIQDVEAYYVDNDSDTTWDDNEDLLILNEETAGAGFVGENIRNFSDYVKHDESEDVNWAYDDGEAIVWDDDMNGVYGEKLEGLTVTNEAPSPELNMNHIAGFILVKENDGNNMVSENDAEIKIFDNKYVSTTWDSMYMAQIMSMSERTYGWGLGGWNLIDESQFGVTWPNKKTAQLSFEDSIGVDETQNYYLFAVVKKGIGGHYYSEFKVDSVDTAGDYVNFTPFTNANMQYVTGQPLDQDYYLPGDNVEIQIFDQDQNDYPNVVEEVTVTVRTWIYDNGELRDEENVLLTETGPSTGLFEGSVPLVHAGGEVLCNECGYPVSEEKGEIGDNELNAKAGDWVVLQHGAATYYPFTELGSHPWFDWFLEDSSLLDTALVDVEAPLLENFRTSCMVENKFIKPGERVFEVDVNEAFEWKVEFYQDNTNFDNDTATSWLGFFVWKDTAEGTWPGTTMVPCDGYKIPVLASDGYYEFTAEAWDNLGQTSSLSKTFIIDNTAPEVLSASADPNTLDNDYPSDVDFAVGATDNVLENIEGSGVAEVWVNVGPLLCENYVWHELELNENTGLWEGTWPAENMYIAEKGKYYLDVMTVDNMGSVCPNNANIDNAADNIVVEMVDDNDDPVLENVVVTYPTGQDSAIENQKVTINADATDPTTVIENVVINAENLGLADNIVMEWVSGNTYEENLTISTDNTGKLQISITANDVARNSTMVKENVMVENQITSYVLDLDEGWNLISFPLIIENPEIENIMAGLEGATMDNVAMIQTYVQRAGDEPGEWLTYEPDIPTEADFVEMKDGKAYWIKMDTSATLTIHGSQQPTGAGEVTPPAYQLYEGWNLVGFTSVNPIEVRTYFGAVDDVVDTWTAAGFNPDTGRLYTIARSGDLQPGAGYWVHVNEYAELPYQSWWYY